MAGFSEYHRGFHHQNPPPELYAHPNLAHVEFAPRPEISSGFPDYGAFGDADLPGVAQDGSAFPSRRNLHLNFSQTPYSNSPESPDDSNGKSLVMRSIGLVGIMADHLLSHPLLVLRRQCQVNVQSVRYHLFPVTLIYPAFRICQSQGISVLWKGLGSTLVVKGMALAVEDVTSKVTPWPKEVSRHGTLKSFMQHILLKSLSLAVITPFYSASLVETVQSEIASDSAGFFDVFREGFWRLLSWPHTGRMVPLHVLVIPTVAHGILSYVIYASIKSVSLATIKRVRESKERKQGALSKDSSVSYYMEMTASLIGHMVADVILFPLETIVHRLHLQGTRTIIDSLDSGLEVKAIRTNYSGVVDCVRTMVEEEGFSGLYKGFGALILQYGLQILLIRTVKIVLETSPFGGSNNSNSSNDKLVVYPPGIIGSSSVTQSRSEPSISSRASPPLVRSPIREAYHRNPSFQDPDSIGSSPRARPARLNLYGSGSPENVAKFSQF